MLLVDVDAIGKLAHWNILPMLPELTGFAWREIGTISSLVHRARKAVVNPDNRVFHTSEAAATAVAVIELMTSRIGLPNVDVLRELAESSGIDAGEAALLASLADDSRGRFLTGDKRALRALSSLPVARCFEGKIILLEHVLGWCLTKKGRNWLLANVCPARSIDMAVKVVLGSRCDASLESIEGGLSSYVGEIESLHIPSLLVSLPDSGYVA